MDQLIINTEYFLQCHGHCTGCFLTQEERDSSNTYKDIVFNGLKILNSKYKSEYVEHLVIGFGRGNILNLPLSNLDELLEIMFWCENEFNYKKLTFEVSTSLIGKLSQQIEKAIYLLSKNDHIFFNIVVNSEITSKAFWENLKQFYEATSNYRIKEKGWETDWGDIIVLNVNPLKLPDLDFIEEFTKDYHSPVNISIFPFDYQDKVNSNNIEQVNQWSKNLWQKLHKKDLNIKNYLENLNKIDIGESLNDILEYQSHTEKSYYFIDKKGLITNGSLSIMGEVDKLRLLDKFNLNLNMNEAYREMQKNKTCMFCEYQKECLLSGAYLNFMANKQKNIHSGCLSGYQELFELAKSM